MTTPTPDGQTRVRRYPVAQTEAADFVELELALFAFLYTGGGERA